MDHNGRLVALDGLRGWAALSVVGFHFFVETFGRVLPQPVVFGLSTVLNGPVAVAVFFVLSGYVLTIGGWRAADKTQTLRLIVKRHARLAIPILAATILVALLLATHLTFNIPGGEIVDRADWLGAWLHLSPSIVSVLGYAMGTAFVTAPGDQAYLPFLWTMTIEFWFSYLVLTLCLLERYIRWPYLILAVIAAIAFFCCEHPSAACFPLGSMLALAQRDGRLARLRLPPLAAIAVVAVASFWGAMAFAMPWVEQLALPAGVTLVLLALVSPQLTAALSTPLSRALGRLSFPLYLAQFPVLASLTSGLIVAWHADRPLTAIAIGLLSIAATLALAVVLLPAEWLAQWVGRQLSRLVPASAAEIFAPRPSSPIGRHRPAASR